MALDNPSYFSLASGSSDSSSTASSSSVFPIFKKQTMGNSLDSASTSSESSLKQTTPTKMQDRKKNNRDLLRSVSTNSADSNQEMLFKGEPRLSDIAPELSYKYPVEPRRANSLKSNRSDNRADLIYSPLATSESPSGEVSEDEEVFLDEETARYYNLSKSGSAIKQRRHSISTFIGRERSVSNASSSKSIQDDLPQAIIHTTPEGNSVKQPTVISIDDHSLRHSSYPRKRCNRCPRGSGRRMADMDDILIISAKESEPSSLWVEYFISYFDEVSKNGNKKPYKIYHLGIEDIIKSNNLKAIVEKAAYVKLQLIILCPTFLEKIAENIPVTYALSKVVMPDRILALQLGTKDEDVTDIHKNALSGFLQWQRRTVGQDQDENFTNDFITTATTIYTKIWKQQTIKASEEDSQFSLSPKKIRQGQTSVLILLTYPLQKEDIIKISILKNDELTELKTIKRRNPYTVKISIPEKFLDVSSIVNILVEKNGSVIGKRPIKCESRLRELEQILRSSNNPVEFMCQSLGFSPHDSQQLDNWMVHMFQKNIPPNFGLFINSNNCNHTKHNGEEFPTLLHFAARYGLEKLTLQLLDCPGGEVACELRNINDLTPAEIAENSGHREIASTLKGYMKMNELAVVYTKIKNLTTESTETEEETYLTPRSTNDFYKICPAPKPINIMTHSPIFEEPAQYLAMDLNKASSIPSCSPVATPSPTTENFPSFQTLTKPKNKNHHTSLGSLHSHRELEKMTMKNLTVLQEDKVQVELAEIINDFKNNVHTIAQTEQLVAEWQNRNDVQKSFKEKQDQLKQMRLRYDQIQRDLKSNNKKSSPFDRIKRIFAWGSKEDKLDLAGDQKSENNSLNQRPISSLSIQSTTSSTSSGRMSTLSGCSLGDSGTHSDHEERKNIISIQSEDEFKPESIRIASFNYLIPPTPKPIKIFHTFPPIEERPVIVKQEEFKNIDNFYIQFPPNGLPVEQKPPEIEQSNEITNNLTQQEYMNYPIHTNDCSHDYMNIK